MALRDEILAFPSRSEPIEVFGKKCTIRILNGRERDQVLGICKAGSDAKNFDGVREKLVAIFLGDINGLRIFDDKDVSDIAKLDGVEQERIRAQGWKLNKFSAESFEEAKKD